MVNQICRCFTNQTGSSILTKIFGLRCKSYILLIAIALTQSVFSQPQENSREIYFRDIISGKDSLVDHVLREASTYNFQLILSVYDYRNGKDTLYHFFINRDEYYFSPASLIKFPLAIVAAEKLTYLIQNKGVSINDSISLSTCSCDKSTDSYIKKTTPARFKQFYDELFIMSNNSAYNFLFDFVGRDEVNKRFKELGYQRIIMNNRFTGGCSDELNKKFGGISFFRNEHDKVLEIPCETSLINWKFDSTWPNTAGKFQVSNKKLINSPKKYTSGNYVSLADAHHMLVDFIEDLNRPEQKRKFKINNDLRTIIFNAMGSFPREMISINYQTENTPDTYYKFFLSPKSMETASNNLRIYNKVGIAGGYISDVSFIEDKRIGLKYFLSGSMHAKKDGIVGNNNYSYYDIGIPVFRKIGELVYRNLSGMDYQEER